MANLACQHIRTHSSVFGVPVSKLIMLMAHCRPWNQCPLQLSPGTARTCVPSGGIIGVINATYSHWFCVKSFYPIPIL